MTRTHILSAYDRKLERLRHILNQMGGQAEQQLALSVRALFERDVDLADQVARGDAPIDLLDEEVDSETFRILALQNPCAEDLREVLTALRMSGDIERIADFACNIAKRASIIAHERAELPRQPLAQMTTLAQSLFRTVLDAYNTQDAGRALWVWEQDRTLDELYTVFFKNTLDSMAQEPEFVAWHTHCLFVAKNLERIGDHATNIAERVYFYIEGRNLQGERPKADSSAGAIAAN
jgi:phosphate transport system protein